MCAYVSSCSCVYSAMYHAEAHRGISTLVLFICPMNIHIKCSIAQLPSCSMLKHSHFIMFFFLVRQQKCYWFNGVGWWRHCSGCICSYESPDSNVEEWVIIITLCTVCAMGYANGCVFMYICSYLWIQGILGRVSYRNFGRGGDSYSWEKLQPTKNHQDMTL